MNSLEKHREKLEDDEFHSKKSKMNFIECISCKVLFDKSDLNLYNGKCNFCN